MDTTIARQEIPKRWVVSPPAPVELQRKLQSPSQPLPGLMVQLLYNRGLTVLEEIQAFLSRRTIGTKSDDPFRMIDMHPAVTRIRQAIRRDEPMAVYGDFDADGVTAAAVLVETINSLGGRVEPYIPRRVDEGYGLHAEALTYLSEKGIRLVITVDCGIRSLAEVEHGRQLGMDIIVTDHHSVGPSLPRAIACINPKRADSAYDFRELAGVGVAFKLAQALLRVERQLALGMGRQPVTEEGLLDLVALGTIADLVPLVGENRYLVHRGLSLMNERAESAARLGVRALIQDARLNAGQINSTHIGYMLAPRLNAAGRLDSAMLSYDLLTSQEPAHASGLADRLGQLNRERQRYTAEALTLAQERVMAQGYPRDLLFIADESFEPGIVGLVAGQLVETYYRPAIVVKVGPDVCRGSCRSIPELHITQALDRCSEAGLLVRHGGHAAAAGFIVERERLNELEKTLSQIVSETLAGRELAPALNIDALVDLQEISWATYEFFSQLEPFGYGNPAPLLASRDIQIVDARPVGGDKHLKLRIADGRREWSAIAFRWGGLLADLPERADIAFQLESNHWNGQTRLELNIQDIRPAGLIEDIGETSPDCQ